jgi:protein NrfC
MEEFGLKREPEKEISRRDFLRGVAAGAAGGVIISSGGFVIWRESEPETEAGVIRIGTVVSPSGYIQWDSDKCVGCERCVLACAMVHGGNTNPQFSSVMWKTEFVEHYMRTPMFCQQCAAPDCYAACPVEGAMIIDEGSGARLVDQAKCIGCRKCIEACTYTPSRISFDMTDKVAIKCDLCRDRKDGPACIYVCSEAGGGRALSYLPREERKI